MIDQYLLPIFGSSSLELSVFFCNVADINLELNEGSRVRFLAMVSKGRFTQQKCQLVSDEKINGEIKTISSKYGCKYPLYLKI